MNKYQVGDVVRHDFSTEEIGTVTEVREHEKYTTFVRWDSSPDRNDWYDPSVLIPVRVSNPTGGGLGQIPSVVTLSAINVPEGRSVAHRGIIGKAPSPDMQNGIYNS